MTNTITKFGDFIYLGNKDKECSWDYEFEMLYIISIGKYVTNSWLSTSKPQGEWRWLFKMELEPEGKNEHAHGSKAKGKGWGGKLGNTSFKSKKGELTPSAHTGVW